ncbi:plasmid mobilization relaxosome protein MobC [uncultured Algoriphagus sp.]|uniref:plasmid mobilization protein n=1 Tax=uncultured Algoriphagus sp. TaxID=417365 RepID=UPI00259319D4|nr:plasmid mobilization relaxosome protein MobC [uncultured Algoriphagus sp.]
MKGNSRNTKNKGFPRRVEGRISESRFQELKAILDRDPSLSMSELIRRILQGQPIRIQVQERGLSNIMERLISVESELKKIGVNLNQVVKAFHGNYSSIQKFLLAKKLLDFRKSLEIELKKMEDILGKLQVKWLSE